MPVWPHTTSRRYAPKMCFTLCQSAIDQELEPEGEPHILFMLAAASES
jgi:hypothetical protein